MNETLAVLVYIIHYQILCLFFFVNDCFSSSSGAVPLAQSPFGNGTGPVFLGGVRCTGHERSLLACQHVRKPRNCGRSQSTGVRCLPGTGKFK